MNIVVYVIFATVLILPIAWFVSELSTDRKLLRCLLGVGSLIALTTAAWFASAAINRLNYNTWYGHPTDKLLSTVINRLEEGNEEVVLKELRALERAYEPTYENRANYNELVEGTIQRLEKNQPKEDRVETPNDKGEQPDYAKALRAIATDIEALRSDYPQLADFTVADHLNEAELEVSYGFSTKASEGGAGWVAGVPNPKEDGIWFYICAHDPDSDRQIHTQPMVAPMHIGKKKVIFLVLEGAKTKRVSAAIDKILKKHGIADGAP